MKNVNSAHTLVVALLEHRLELSEYHEDSIGDLKSASMGRSSEQRQILIPEYLYTEFERMAQVHHTSVERLLTMLFSIGLIAMLEKESEPDTHIIIHNSQREHSFPLE